MKSNTQKWYAMFSCLLFICYIWKKSKPKYQQEKWSMKKNTTFFIQVHSMQRGLRLPSTTNCLGPPPQMIVPHPSNFYILSASPLHLCVFIVCMFVKNQLNQSEEEIYCHISLITLLACRLCFILLTHRISIKKNTFNPFVFFLCSSIFGGTTVL